MILAHYCIIPVSYTHLDVYKRQVFSPTLTEPLAHSMKAMGVKRGMIVCGCDGMDEITLTGTTHISEIKDDNVTSYDINPADYGLKITDAEQLKGGNGEENAETTKAILAGKETGAKRDIVLLNAGAAIYCAGIADTLAEGIEKAKESIDSGKALEVLNKLVEFTNR